MLIYDPARKHTPGWQASLLGRPANRRDRWGGPLWVWHDDSMMIVMILLYVYIYMYIPVYIIRSLFFSVLTVCQKKMPLGGEFRMEWHATEKTNSCSSKSASSFWASAQPTLGRSVSAVLRPLRTSDESWWDLTQHIKKNCDMCVIFLIFEKLPRTFKDLEVFRRNSLHDFLEAERTVGCVLGCHFVWKCLSRNCLMILDSMTHPSPHGSPVESLWKQMAPSGIINRRYWPNDSKSCRGFEPAVPGCMERNSHL